MTTNIATPYSLTDHVLDPTYYARMESSLGDKARMLTYVVGETVVDVGCGSGALAAAARDSLGVQVCGVDPFPHPDAAIDVLAGFADEVHEVVPGAGTVDTVLASSVLHEVFSYGNRCEQVQRWHAVHAALASFYKALRPGGRLIIRDGVHPGKHGEQATMDVHTESRNEAVRQFLKDSPFSPRNSDKPLLNLRHLGGTVWAGTRSSIMEFAFTHTWGINSYPREVNEFYGLDTVGGYAARVESTGFHLLHTEAYVQPGYVEHLSGVVEFHFEFPATNALWVYERI